VDIVIKKNVLSDSIFKEVIEEIGKNKFDVIDRGFSKFDRWYPPAGNKLIKIAEEMIYAENIKKEVDNYRDLAWRWFVSEIANSRFEVQTTKYHIDPNYRYMWHTDHNVAALRTLNYILYLNDNFKGGELQVSGELIRNLPTRDDYEITLNLKPEKNMLVIMPSWMLHRVLPITSGSPRLTLNGHVIKS